MKKYKLKNLNIFLFTLLILMYLEIVFRLLTKGAVFNISLLYVFLYSVFTTLLICFFATWGSNRVNKGIYYVTLFVITCIFVLQLCIFKMFGFYFDLSLLSATDQVMSFTGDALKLIFKNLLGILLLFLPFIGLLIFHRKFVIDKQDGKGHIGILSSCIIIYMIFIGSLYLNGNEINSARELYFQVSNHELNIRKFGVLNAFRIDIKRTVFGFEGKLNITDDDVNQDVDENGDKDVNQDDSDEENNEEKPEYEYNRLDIDFASLIAKESDSTIRMMHEYFQKETGTLQNEYTNYFKDKNLILFMAEGFNEIAVRQDITPTLYRLVNSGFKFNNFYTPSISSTIGGEFQELTGLVAASGFLPFWKSGENAYPFGIATSFQKMGYQTYAYHNHTYTFQNRNKYLASLGFDHYLGCRNGLEKRINCNRWPESDVEMIEGTVTDYLGKDEPFMVYYVTVSGHGDYTFSSNAMASKHRNDVAGLNYSEKPLAYLAVQIELDQALELLIEKLTESGELEDTVIALVGDHYPYYLSLDEVNELASYEKDSVVEINRSNFILWNSEMETITVDKVGSQIDVLPTIYNLFGVEYDSRLIIGKDILSTEPGVAIFANSAWVSDQGTYYASSGEFVSRDGISVDSDYVRKMNNIVSNKILLSRYIMQYDYYRRVLGE